MNTKAVFILFFILSVCFAMFWASCDSLLRVCTQAGCDDSFIVSLEGDIPDHYTLLLVYAGTDSLSAECLQEEECHGFHDFGNIQPKELEVKLAWDEGSISRSVEP